MSVDEIREAKDELIKMSNDDTQRELYEMRAKTLKDNGIEVTVRREMGTDINAACGQLRRSYLEENK